MSIDELLSIKNEVKTQVLVLNTTALSSAESAFEMDIPTATGPSRVEVPEETGRTSTQLADQIESLTEPVARENNTLVFIGVPALSTQRTGLTYHTYVGSVTTGIASNRPALVMSAASALVSRLTT